MKRGGGCPCRLGIKCYSEFEILIPRVYGSCYRSVGIAPCRTSALPDRWTVLSHSLAYERNMPNILKILHYVVFGMGFVTAMDFYFDFLNKRLSGTL